MRKKRLGQIIGCFVLGLSAFVFGYIHLADYSGTDLLLLALASIILMAVLYLPSHTETELFSPAWAIGVIVGMGLFAVGLSRSDIFIRSSESEIHIAWGYFMWFSGFQIMCNLSLLPKEHKIYKCSFFKRIRPIEEGEDESS